VKIGELNYTVSQKARHLTFHNNFDSMD